MVHFEYPIHRRQARDAIKNAEQNQRLDRHRNKSENRCSGIAFGRKVRSLNDGTVHDRSFGSTAPGGCGLSRCDRQKGHRPGPSTDCGIVRGIGCPDEGTTHRITRSQIRSNNQPERDGPRKTRDPVQKQPENETKRNETKRNETLRIPLDGIGWSGFSIHHRSGTREYTGAGSGYNMCDAKIRFRELRMVRTRGSSSWYTDMSCGLKNCCVYSLKCI